MTAYTRFKINSSQVAQETIDGEVVIINLQSGIYYSLQNVGASIWGLIENGMTIDQTIDSIARQYDGNRSDIDSGVNQLITELKQADLIEPVEETVNPDAIPTETEIIPETTEKPRFEMPVLQQYEDMQDLLLLDPIHEVDDTGWPNRPEPN
jgi:transposase-like protein